MKQISTQKYLLFLYPVLLLLSIIQPIYPQEMYLQHSASLVVFGLLLYAFKKKMFSNLAFFCIFLFMVFHFIAARWIYSYVPYNEWFINIFGFDFQAYFEFKRNHFDRLIHFLFGLLFFLPFVELLQKKIPVQYTILGFLSIMIVFGLSAIYEVFEWGITLFLSPDSIENYNGQQGDVFDGQKDMALAGLGSILSFIGLKNRTTT